MQHVIYPGAAYHEGDPIRVEHEGAMHEGTVIAIEPLFAPRPFGVRWSLAVRLDDGRTTFVACDDDGRNHTIRERVMWSERVAA